MFKRGLLLVVLGLVSWQSPALADAWENSSVTRSSSDDRNPPLNKITVDTAYMLLRGAGVGYEREIAPEFSFGPFVNFFTLPSNNESLGLQTEYKALIYGLRGRYFLTGNAHRSGFYVGGGAGVISAEDKVVLRRSDGEKVPGTAKSNEFAYQGGAGYQVAAQMSESTSLVFDLGAVFGHGYAYQTRAAADIYSTTADTELMVRDSVYFELSVGLLF